MLNANASKTVSQPTFSQPTFSQQNIANTKENLKTIANEFKQYHHIYYNPKSSDKSAEKSKGLHINYNLITRDSRIEQLENEKDEFYDFLNVYVETRSFKRLFDYIQINIGAKVSRRQLFYIAKKFDWKSRIEKYDSEINFELMSELHGKYAKCKSNRLENAIEMYENANKIMDTFHNVVTSDLEALKQYKEFDDEMCLKRAKDVIKIYTDYSKLTEKLEEIIEKEDLKNFNPIQKENLNSFEKEFEIMEDNDELNLLWNNFKDLAQEKINRFSKSSCELTDEEIEKYLKKA